MQIVYVEFTQAVRERLLAEAARAEKDRLKDLLEDAPAYIAVVRGPEHVFEIANKQIARLAGDRVLLGRRLVDAVPEIVEQGFVALLDKVYATGKAVKASRSAGQAARRIRRQPATVLLRLCSSAHARPGWGDHGRDDYGYRCHAARRGRGGAGTSAP